jgi:predicted nuclease of predicted toxin-antitoxin system
MKVLIDMNLSPVWVSAFEAAGHTPVHWSTIGSPQANDREILSWARQNDSVVFTHDLDFGAILAATDADSPSVIQIRTQDPTPENCGSIILNVLHRYTDVLTNGALVSVDESRARLHILPLRQNTD